MSSSSVGVPLERITSTAIERYLAAPSHGNGMVFDARLRLDQRLDQARLQDAWLKTVMQNPQLHSVWRGKRQKAHWQPAGFDSTKFSVDIVQHHDRRQIIDQLRPEIGVFAKLVIVQWDQAQGSDLWFFFHHTGCDGVGAVRIVSRTLQRYDGHQTQISDQQAGKTKRSGGEPTVSEPPIRVPDPRNLWATIRGRNLRINASRPCPSPTLDSSPALRLTSQRSKHGGFTAAETSVENFPTHQRLRFSRELSAQLQNWLRSHQLALNDFAVAVALDALTITRKANSKKFVCIMNPVQTRTWDLRRATRNHIGFAFIRRRIEDLNDLPATITDVRDELEHIRKESIANELGTGLEVLERIPGAIGLIERTGWFCPTASVTCLSSLKFGKRHGMRRAITGDAEKPTENPAKRTGQTLKSFFVGDAEVKDLEIVGPLQSGGQLAITIWDSPQGISATFRYADQTVQRAYHEIAKRFCDTFSTRIEI